MPKYNPEHETVMNNMMKSVPNATSEKMFGFPVYKTNGTMAVSVKPEGIIAKVGEKRAQELIGKPGVNVYEPQKGRVWKDWVLLTDNFDANKAVFSDAINYVSKQSK